MRPPPPPLLLLAACLPAATCLQPAGGHVRPAHPPRLASPHLCAPSARRRRRELDKRILSLAGPAIANFLILPITQSVDLFFIGKLNCALAIAGQAAANQIFSSAAWISSVVPVVTVPRVARAKAAGDEEAVQRAVGEGVFVTALISTAAAVAIGLRQRAVLLAAGSVEALPYSTPYLRYRLPGLVAEGVSTIGFSAFRGVMDTVTPLKIALASNVLNVILVRHAHAQRPPAFI